MIPFDMLKAELFYPTRKENVATTSTVQKMAVEMAECFLKELRDPKKATSDYLTSAEGKFSWGYTTEDDHNALIGKSATNDSAERPFAMLTQQIQQFGTMLGIHASAVGQAKMNGDFKRDHQGRESTGSFLQLPKEMKESLLRLALKIAPDVRSNAQAALDRQRESRKLKMDTLRKKKLLAAQYSYAAALTFIEMYHSDACWKTTAAARKKFNELGSETAKRDAVKDQIRIRVNGLGWKDLHHAWSLQGVDYTANQLLQHLMMKVIPAQNDGRVIPESPHVDLPSRKNMQQLGTRTLDIDDLDEMKDEEIEKFEEGRRELREEMEEDGLIDRYEKLQDKTRPTVDETMIDVRIEQLWEYVEEDGTVVKQWCSGVVVAVKTQNRVLIRWDKEHIQDGLEITQQKLMVSKWNKHVSEGWRKFV